jgi:hypothetical protein
MITNDALFNSSASESNASTELAVIDPVELEKTLKQKQIEKIGHEIQKIKFDIHQQAGVLPRFFDAIQKIIVPLLVAFFTWLATNAQVAPLKAEKDAAKVEAVEAKLEAKKSDAKAISETNLKSDAYEKMNSLAIEYDKSIETIQTVRSNGAGPPENAKLIEDINKIKKSSPVFLKQIFIQFKGEMTRDQINQLRTRLGENGFAAPQAERLSNVPGNEIRYFVDSPDERQRAEQSGQIIKDFFNEKNCPLDMKIKLVKLPSGKPSPLEAWLYPICK